MLIINLYKSQLMKVIIFILLLLISISPFAISNHKNLEQEESEALTTGPNYLTFTNTKGLMINDVQITSFKSYAVSASTFYGTSALDNLKFITTQMNDAYTISFNTFLQTSTAVYTNYVIDSIYGETYASFSPGVNRVQPQWSYLLFANKQYIQPMPYVFTNGIGQGSGYTSAQIQTITDAINNNEGPPGVCYCFGSLFHSLVANISNIANNVICQSGSPTYSYFQVFSDKWLVIKPRECYYTIWSNN